MEEFGLPDSTYTHLGVGSRRQAKVNHAARKSRDDAMRSTDTMGYQLEPKLEAVLAALCAELGPMFKTQVVKLPYLVDVVANRVLGRPITRSTHQTWEHGVVTREAYRFFSHEDVGPLFTETKHEYSESGARFGLADGASVPDLSPEEQAVIEFVAKEFGDLPPSRLGDLTKLMNTELGADDWGSNTEARTDREAYLRLQDRWQELGERLPVLDLEDRELWGKRMDKSPMTHLRRSFA